ncbi:class I SAM-dependent methyltransferase [Singulisphaera rosea]
MDVIPFTPRRFQSAAASYIQGRPAYPFKLFRRIAEIGQLNTSHRVMDLGCGPGQVAVGLAPFVGRVVAVDPEPEMLTLAAELAKKYGDRIELVEGSSYDLGPEFGRFQVVAMGRSFHWMDRAETLRRLDAMIEPAGAVVLLHDEHPGLPDNAWYAPFQQTVMRYAADDVAKSVRSKWAAHEAVLLESPFSQLERVSVFERRRVSLDELVLRLQSMSSVAHSRIGPKADELALDIRREMSAFARAGFLDEVVVYSALLATRHET